MKLKHNINSTAILCLKFKINSNAIVCQPHVSLCVAPKEQVQRKRQIKECFSNAIVLFGVMHKSPHKVLSKELCVRVSNGKWEENLMVIFGKGRKLETDEHRKLDSFNKIGTN